MTINKEFDKKWQIEEFLRRVHRVHTLLSNSRVFFQHARRVQSIGRLRELEHQIGVESSCFVSEDTYVYSNSVGLYMKKIGADAVAFRTLLL